MNNLPPCVVHEDEHLLVVAKPAGIATHAPSPYAGEGLYEWLKHREPRWASLAIVHRLDKETSGVMVFALTPLANRELTAQFGRHEVRKRYALIVAGAAPRGELRVETGIARAGERYVARPAGAGEGDAVTVFRPRAGDAPGRVALEAEPVTGRTHQIRVHAAASGFPVLGDALYGGAPAARLCLHAESLAFRHPATGAAVAFEVPADFGADARRALRAAFIDPADTDAWRVAHGAPDGWPGARVDRLGDWVLHQAEEAPGEAAVRALAATGARGVYHRALDRQVRRRAAEEASPRLVAGEAAPERFTVRENGVRYELSLAEGYSTGLFLDQRDNRRRFLVNHVAAGFPLFPGGAAGATLLNVFAYTCAFSACAALAGATTTSLDLSRKYLDRGRRNFELNGLDPAAHDFIYGDAFDWLRRLARKGRRYGAIVLDPPTFSQSKARGVFRAERDYGALVAAVLPVLAPGGVLLAATNAARLAPEAFVATVREAVHAAGRRIGREHYAPQPPDFPVSRAEPAYLKAYWLRIS
jgi:23S rRNA (cytosine1962-C5)-methyltransferase